MSLVYASVLKADAKPPAFDDAGDAFAPTRSNYDRFVLLLARRGRVPEAGLRALEFQLLVFLLGQKPGHYAAHHHTIAAACDSNVTSIRRALGRLRDAGLVLWELVPPHHRLPSGRYTRTNVNRYWVHLPRLAELLGPMQERPSTRPIRDASTLPISDASSGREILSEPRPPSLLPPAVSANPPQEPLREGREAVLSKGSEHELAPVREAWERLELGPLGTKERRALENRQREGASREQLLDAIAGAQGDGWLRRHAKVPFAVVFASLASVERFAHEGRKTRPSTSSLLEAVSIGQEGRNLPCAAPGEPSGGACRRRPPATPLKAKALVLGQPRGGAGGSVEQGTENPRVDSSIPPLRGEAPPLVERRLPKPMVAEPRQQAVDTWSHNPVSAGRPHDVEPRTFNPQVYGPRAAQVAASPPEITGEGLRVRTPEPLWIERRPSKPRVTSADVVVAPGIEPGSDEPVVPMPPGVRSVLARFYGGHAPPPAPGPSPGRAFPTREELARETPAERAYRSQGEVERRANEQRLALRRCISEGKF